MIEHAPSAVDAFYGYQSVVALLLYLQGRVYREPEGIDAALEF
jgi:hypothetical protein